MRKPGTCELEACSTRWPIATVVVASILVAVVAWTRPVSAASVLTGWAACYCFPVAIIVGKRVPLRKLMRVSVKLILCVLPFTGMYALLGFAVSGEVGLAGAFGASLLCLGWGSLFAAAFAERSVMRGL